MTPAAARIDPLFQSHPLNDSGRIKYVTIGEAFTELLDRIQPLCIEGREWSIVRTKLEEASFYARKSMSGVRPNQQLEGIGASG